MEDEIVLLEYFEKPRNIEDVIDFDSDVSKTITMFKKFLKRGYLEVEKEFYELTEKGENRLIELKKRGEMKSTTINFHGNNNNVIGNSEKSSINQEVLSQVPKKERKWYQKFLSSLISTLGVKITLTLLGGVSFGTFIFNHFNHFNPILFGEVTLNNLIFIFGCIFLWLTYYAFKNSKENRCGKCGKYFSYAETSDSNVLAESPKGNRAKIERTLKCSNCGDEKLEVKWEELE